MFSRQTMIRPSVTALAGVFLLSACATNPDGSVKLDNRVTGALAGAAIGCVAADASGGNCATGAAIGAAAGFLVGWYFESKKVADATQVNNEYQRKGVAVPKGEIRPVAFTTRVKQSAADAKGSKEVQMTSNTDMIGYGDRTPQMSQKYAIYDEKNNVVEEKSEKIAAVDGAGRYQTSSKFRLPPAEKGKSYTVKTTLVVDNKPYKENSYKVSFADGATPMIYSSSTIGLTSMPMP